MTAKITMPFALFLATTLSASAITDAEIVEYQLKGIMNIGNALWAVFGALLLLAGAVLFIGLKIAKALSKNRED